MGELRDPTTAFQCGVISDHECDNNGPEIYGGEGVPTTTVRPDSMKGYTWGSVTCSICGSSSMDRSMWRDF